MKGQGGKWGRDTEWVWLTVRGQFEGSLDWHNGNWPLAIINTTKQNTQQLDTSYVQYYEVQKGRTKFMEVV